jgi:hypothetical protein
MQMPWLYRDTERLCPVIVACTPRQRLRGLLGRTRIEGAILLQPASSVHTFGMRFDLDVVHLDQDLRVLRVITMRPNRLGRPIAHARSVLEAEAGSLTRLRVGDRLSVQSDHKATR